MRVGITCCAAPPPGVPYRDTRSYSCRPRPVPPGLLWGDAGWDPRAAPPLGLPCCNTGSIPFLPPGSPFQDQEQIMAAPRRLRNLNLDTGNANLEGEGHENPEGNGNDESLQDPPNIDGFMDNLTHQPKSPIKIIWPNGSVRLVVGDFKLPSLLKLQGGNVMVGTDKNGVTNERSASILGKHLGTIAQSSTLAPLHIQRWDNALFNPLKKQILEDVEERFLFPLQTLQLTRDWILKTVNNRWRQYKSLLKQQHFNQQEKTLDEIIKGRPPTVNEIQWKALVGFWCQESHKKLCSTNSRCAKVQKNTHTTGRKSHARLLREMEKNNKRKIHRVELYDAAHKKKNGRYSSEKVKELMEASFVEIKKRKAINGTVSAQDFNQIFNDIVAKELKSRGYFDDKYWSSYRVSRGLTFDTTTEEDKRCKKKVHAMENKVDCMSGIMQHWLAFMSKKYPEEDFITEMKSALHDLDYLSEGEADSDEDGYMDDDMQGKYWENQTEHMHEHSDDDGYSLPHDVQGRMDDPAHNTNGGTADHTSVPLSQTNSKGGMEQLPVQNTNGDTANHRSVPLNQTNAKEAHNQSSTQEGHVTAGNDMATDPILRNMVTRRVKAPIRNEIKEQVYLLSLEHKGRVLAKGEVVTKAANRNIGGIPLGPSFVGVYVIGLENIGKHKGDEKIPRPIFDIEKIMDAVGSVIPWPRTHVMKATSPHAPKSV